MLFEAFESIPLFFFNSVPTTCFHCIHPHCYRSAVPLNDAHSVSRGKHQKKSAPCYLVRIPPRGALLTDGNKPQPLLLLSLPHFHPTLLQTFIAPTNVIVEAFFFFFLGLLRMTIRVDSTRLCWCFCLELSQNQTCSVLSQFYIFLTFKRKRNVEKVNRCLPSCDAIRWTN